MLPLHQAISNMVTDDSFLQYGLQYCLFNLTKLAEHTRKHLEARTKKSVSTSAVLMALSRYQRGLKKFAPHPSKFRVKHLTLRTDLATVSVAKTAQSLTAVHDFHTRLQKTRSYITITESTGEVTLLFEATHLALAKKLLGRGIKFSNETLAALALHFSPEYAAEPGFLCAVLQQLLLQGINVVEVASTYTEFVLYIEEKDAKLAFDTLYGLFRISEKNGVR
jgi:aspartokinase